MSIEQPTATPTAEEVLANSILRSATSGSSAALGRFSTWLLAAIAASLLALLANLAELAPYISVQQIKRSAVLLLVALAIGVLGKYIEMILQSAKDSSAETTTIARLDESAEPDIGRVLLLVERTTWPPAKWLIRRQLRALAAGDLLKANGFLFHAAQVQALLTLAVTLLALAGVFYFVLCLAA